ncbi:MAG: hypothetical protein ACI8QZ_001753 [Chlamydiales bacterium]|jgi:hypothetical protein
MSHAEHPLVVIGDSLSQGFMHGAVTHTGHSFGAMIATALGVEARFQAPSFEGAGGLPVNIEALLREMSRHFGESVSWYEFVPMLTATRGLMAHTEDYWERGPGSRPGVAEQFHNLSVWGFGVRDTYSLNGRVCRNVIGEPKDNFTAQVPEHAMYRTAARVLNPSADPKYDGLTVLDTAQQMGNAGGIERLVVALGANNALGTVLSLKVKWSEDADLHRLPFERDANLFRAEHFEILYGQLEERIERIGAENVFVATVPHVTVPPVTRGVSPGGTEWNPDHEVLSQGGSTARRYYEYYTRPWIWDDLFNPKKHDFLTRAEAIEIDTTIDAYNEVVREAAARRGWHVVDMCGMLDDLAYRSSGGHPACGCPAGLVNAVAANPYTRYLVEDGRLMLDTRFIKASRYGGSRSGIQRIERGGIFGLDGIHPGVIGTSLVADLFLESMKGAGAAPADVELEWDDIVDADRLVVDPPALLVDLQKCLAGLERHWGLSDILKLF